MISPVLLAIAQALHDGRVDAAEEACRAGLAAQPQDAALLQAAALIASAAGRRVEALARARTALTVAPGHVPTMILAGRTARALGELEASAGWLERAMQLAPERAEPAFLLCAVRLEAADPKAMDLLDHLTRRFPTDAAGWSEIGGALIRAGKPQAALAAFERIEEAEPSSTLALRRATLLRELGRLPEARDALRAASERGPMPAPAWFSLGLVLQDLGDSGAAAAAYRRAVEVDPTLAEASVNLGIVKQQGGDLEGAKAAYGDALQVRPDTFGRIAQAMTTSSRGELWLDLEALRTALLDR